MGAENKKAVPRGIGVALVTPFTGGGEIDWASLERLVEHVVSGGVHFLVVLGTTAETPTLSVEERQKVLSFVRERVGGRVPLVAGVGGYNTAEVVKMLHELNLEGYCAVLSVTPYYNKPTQRGLIEHFRRVADASPLPVILYNVPGRTGVNMLASTTLLLADVENIAGIKEASGNVEQAMEILAGRPQGFRVYSGDDALNMPYFALGMDGAISVLANALPKETVAVWEAAGRGELGQAAELHFSLLPLIKLLFAEGNPVGVKAVLHAMGVISTPMVRLPLVSASAELREKVVRELSRLKGVMSEHFNFH